MQVREHNVSPAPGTHAWCSRKALVLKDYLHGFAKAGWLLAAQGENINYEMNAYKPYCFLRWSHTFDNYQ